MPASVGPRKHAVQHCSVARAHSLQARLLVLSCIYRYPMPEKRVPRSAMARQCRSLLLLVLAEVEELLAPAGGATGRFKILEKDVDRQQYFVAIPKENA